MYLMEVALTYLALWCHFFALAQVSMNITVRTGIFSSFPGVEKFLAIISLKFQSGITTLVFIHLFIGFLFKPNLL